MRFFWPLLRDIQADLADLVWLQLIKDGNPKLYRWIEEYCAAAAAISVGTTRIEEDEKKRELDELLKNVPEDYFEDSIYRFYFAEQLPGIEVDYTDDGDKFSIFNPVADHDRDKSIQNKRLASPDHYRHYFALAAPSHALTQEDFISMWAAAQADSQQAGAKLLQLHTDNLLGTLSKADILLERVKGGAVDVLAPIQCKNLLLAFSHVMDEAYRNRPFDQFWVNSIWDRAQALIPVLLSRLEVEQRAATVTSMFDEGRALGWLTSLFRRETFAHGRYGERLRPEDTWLFTDTEFGHIVELMLKRYRQLSANDLFGCPNPIDVLFAWRQGGDEEGPRRLVEASANSDEGLIRTLEHLTSTIQSSSRGKVEVLKKENLEPFTNFEHVVQRINALRSHDSLGDRAERLADAFDYRLEH